MITRRDQRAAMKVYVEYPRPHQRCFPRCRENCDREEGKRIYSKTKGSTQVRSTNRMKNRIDLKLHRSASGE